MRVSTQQGAPKVFKHTVNWSSFNYLYTISIKSLDLKQSLFAFAFIQFPRNKKISR